MRLHASKIHLLRPGLRPADPRGDQQPEVFAICARSAR